MVRAPGSILFCLVLCDLAGGEEVRVERAVQILQREFLSKDMQDMSLSSQKLFFAFLQLNVCASLCST